MQDEHYRPGNLPPPSDVDWQALWQALTIDESERQRRELAQRLSQRARQYASLTHIRDDLERDHYQTLVFALGGEQYALEVGMVQGVRPLGRLTRVPGTPPFYVGVLNVRGQVRTIFDLRTFLGQPSSGEMPRELILVEAGRLALAFLADQVVGVSVIPAGDVLPTDIPYARGITREHLIVLDAQALFADDRLIVGGGEDLL